VIPILDLVAVTGARGIEWIEAHRYCYCVGEGLNPSRIASRFFGTRRAES
jgi:hypothetical protein